MGIGFEVQMLSNTKYGDPGWTPLKQNKKKDSKKKLVTHKTNYTILLQKIKKTNIKNKKTNEEST